MVSARTILSVVLAAGFAYSALPLAQAQVEYDQAIGELARLELSKCADAHEPPDQYSPAEIISTCTASRDTVIQLYMSRTSNTDMDLNFLRIYAGVSAYAIMNSDLKKNENTLSLDGCSNADYVVKMFDELTSATNTDVEAQLSDAASIVREHVIPWCDRAYPPKK